MSGCLSGDEDDTEGNGDEAEGTSDESTDGGDEPEESSDESNDDGSEESIGTAEITFLGETYTYDDASCRGSRTFPPENEMIRHRDVDDEIEFELGTGTSGSVFLEPSDHMNDDVAHDPDGGEVVWEIAC
ncbi:hypothetical protein [Natronococcus sp.]|uniref:hypothetical protein n=1 Tax=Natronococcus sp. TaxID=35747 RepID=UPI003A4E00D1